MTELSPHSYRLTRVGAGIARVALWLLALAWTLLILVWGGLHLLIVPGISQFRPLLEAQASKAIGATVHIGAIEVRSSGFIPAFELKQVTLHDTQGRETLRLPSVVVALSPRSALGMGFEQLYLDGPVLNVRRSADGQIWVAGFAVPAMDTGDSAGTDWLFSQAEIVVRHGTVQWTDEVRGAPPLTLTEVDAVLRNKRRTHALRLDAIPPAEWGGRFSVRALFDQPLLSLNAGRWREWDGQLYADFEQVDLAHLRRYANLGVALDQGSGAMRAWVDVRRGTFASAVADVALKQVNVTVSPRLDPLALQWVQGRLGARVLDGGMEFSTEGLQFDLQDGLHWPGGNVRVATYPGDTRTPARGELVGDRLDLVAMAQIANRLPLGDEVHDTLLSLAPQGLVERIQATWQGAGDKPTQFAAKGRVVGLELNAGAATVADGPGRPGVKGAAVDFDFNQSGGRADLVMRNGQLDFPGIFEESQIPVEQLTTEVQWKQDGGQISVTAPTLRFSNADADGVAQLKWQTGDVHRFPGVLDLQGELSRADAGRVHRYLPLPIDKSVREYVRNAIPSGKGTGVKFKVKGKLDDFPFETAKQGDFRISANLTDVLYDYAPASIQSQGSLPWPALAHATGEFVIDRSVLQVKLARSNLVGGPGLRVDKVEGVVSKLYDGATVAVTADIQGPLSEALAVVNSSPLGAMTGKALARATATEAANYRFKLAFPIAAVERATVQGTVVLGGNDIQILPETPRLSRARGTVAFSETGFSVSGAQARALGGDVRIDGGLSTAAPAVGKALPPVLRIQGTATAEGLQQARELGLPARLARYATGSSAYSVVVGLRSGMPELQISSNLTGLALRLPAPFAKSADTPLPLRLATSVLRTAVAPGGNSAGSAVATQDQLQLDIGSLVNIVYQRDITGPEARVLRGSIAVGLTAEDTAPMPESGVLANINTSSLDLDAWRDVLSQASGTDLSASALAAPASDAGMGYLPTTLAVRARELTLGGRKLNNVVVGAGRQDSLWRANLDAAELNGYVEYRQASGAAQGRLYGRLARLVIAPSAAQEVERILDEQPAGIPALDIVVEDFELRGKKLGRIEIDAVNLMATAAGSAREWRLNRFNIKTPEAVLTANGNWTDINAQATRSATRSIKDRRRTVLNFKLAIGDAGALLERFGMKGVIRKGNGKIEGQVAWLGSPITLDYPSLSGNFNVGVEDGQFLKAEPGIAKLLGVLSLQSLPRRLVLDFRDVFTDGFSFDFLRGDVAIEQGIARTNNLQMKGVNAAVLMEGQADIAKETQAIKVVVVPEINAGSASLIASIVNPVVGLSTFLAQAILRRPLMEAATQEFWIDGTWVDPRVTKVDRKTGKPEDSK